MNILKKHLKRKNDRNRYHSEEFSFFSRSGSGSGFLWIVLPIVLIFYRVTFSFPLEISIGPSIATISPVEEQYDDRFRTPGTAWGVNADLLSGGPLAFAVYFNKFEKESHAGAWWGETKAISISVYPRYRVNVYPGLEVYGGAGAVYVDASYAGLDEFGRLIEADGSSIGFGFTCGIDLKLYGPIYGRVDFRRSFMTVKNDNARIDEQEVFVYPAAETDLGSSHLGLALMFSIVGGEDSLLDL